MKTFLQLRWLGRDRVIGYSMVLAFASAVSMYWLFQEAMKPGGSDFVAFWSASKSWMAGHAGAVYDPRSLMPIQATVGHPGVVPFVNPPPLLFVIWPLGFFSYPVAWILWVAATYGLWLAATRRLAPPYLTWSIAAFPGALLAAWHAQTGFLTSTFQALAATWLRDRPFRAGLCIGALVIKPHLAVLFPFALIASRSWRAIYGAATGVIGLCLAAWAVFGTDTMLSYPNALDVSSYFISQDDDVFFLRQVTVYAALRVFATPQIAAIAQALTTLAMIAATWRIWAAAGETDGKLAFLFSATPLATPYLFSYDLPFLIIPFCWLAAHCKGDWARPALILLYLSPLMARAIALPIWFNPMPIVSLITVASIWRILMRQGGKQV